MSGSSAEQVVEAALEQAASHFARDREAGGLSTGDRAELRRLDPAKPLVAAFWRLVTDARIEEAVARLSQTMPRDRAERAFATLFQALAELGNPYGGDPVGRVLAETKYAEARLVHLLRARGDEVAVEAAAVARWCAANGRRVRLTGPNGFGTFILSAAPDDPERTERCAHAIARDYFTAQAKAERATAASET